MARAVPLFSGSKGNSYYIGSASQGVLIDAGRSCRQIESAMQLNGLSMDRVSAVFVTHEHIDHCAALRVLVKRYGLKVYASAGTMRELEKSSRLEPDADAEVITDGVSVGDMFVERFDTPHDAAESCCFRVTAPDGKKALVATDMGVMLPMVRAAAKQSDFVVLESNHDIEMLKNGVYPYYLKRRILSDVGHLSNIACAHELAELVEEGTLRLMLGHLSEHNNTVPLALSTTCDYLSRRGMKLGIDYTLDVAPSVCSAKTVIF